MACNFFYRDVGGLFLCSCESGCPIPMGAQASCCFHCSLLRTQAEGNREAEKLKPPAVLFALACSEDEGK